MLELARYDSYKNTDVVWLDEIPTCWSGKRLKYLVSITTGSRDTQDRVEGGEYPFFVRSQMVERIDTYSYEEEAVLTAGDGDIGKIFHHIDGRFEVHQRVYKFSDFRDVCGRFFYYYLQANLEKEVVKLSAKSTVDSLRLPMLQNFTVFYPDKEVQRRVVSFLDEKTAEIDDAIAKKQRLIELLQEQKAILINRAVTRGIDPGAPLRESGVEWIGEIPAHWAVKRLKYMFAEVNSRTTTGEETLLSLRMYEGLVPHDEVSDKPIPDADLVDYKHVHPGQLVMNRMRAAIGLFAVADRGGLVSPDYAIFDIIDDVDPNYYLHLFKTSMMGSIFRLESKGLGTGSSGFMRLYSDRFGSISVPVPPRNEQTEIVRFIDSAAQEYSRAQAKIEAEIDLLKEFRSILISDAVTGKIKV